MKTKLFGRALSLVLALALLLALTPTLGGTAKAAGNDLTVSWNSTSASDYGLSWDKVTAALGGYCVVLYQYAEGGVDCTEIFKTTSEACSIAQYIDLNAKYYVLVEALDANGGIIASGQSSEKVLDRHVTSIYVVGITGLTRPYTGDLPQTGCSVVSGDTNKYKIDSVRWYCTDENRYLADGERFGAGKSYEARVFIEPRAGWHFSWPIYMSATHNGEAVSVYGYNSGLVSDTSLRCITVDFGATEASLKLTKQPADAAPAGTNYFTVAASGGTAPYSYKWQYAVGSPVTFSDVDGLEGIAGFTNSVSPTLAISLPQTMKDAGAYFRCRITDAAGAVVFSDWALVVSYDHITVTYTPSSITGAIGDSVRLSAVTDLTVEMVDDASLVTRQWYRASSNYYGTGEAIPGADINEIVVPIDKEGTWWYYCEFTAKVFGKTVTSAADDAAMVKATCAVGTPVIKTHPEAQDIKPGAAVTFKVAATGTGLHYKWYMVDAGMPEVVGTDSATLALSNVSDQYNGLNFYCVVSNANGQAVSKKAHLAVSNTPYAFPFTDVPSQWYYKYIKQSNKLGLIDGTTATTYTPNGSLTIASAIKLAACINQLYYDGEVTLKNGSPWYKSYYDYCVEHGIISKTASALEPGYDYYVAHQGDFITRRDFALLFSRALPEKALAVRNFIPDDSIPDVPLVQGVWSAAIYKLYRAGILNGTDDDGNYKPNTYIDRASVAAILVRMMDETYRVGAPKNFNY